MYIRNVHKYKYICAINDSEYMIQLNFNFLKIKVSKLKKKLIHALDL